MKNYGQNKIFVEGKSDKLFIDFLLSEYFKIEDEKVVISVGGKDNLKNQPDLLDTRRIDEKAKNLVVFDTDTLKNEGGREAKIKFINQIADSLNVKFELFLLPFDNEIEGMLEDLLQTLFDDKLMFFDECWDNMIDCFKKTEIVNLNIPAQKAKIFSKIDLFEKHKVEKWKTKPEEYNFTDKGIWNINFKNNPSLKKLITFIENNLFNE
ncbi:hypothetical protein INQ45_08395 [Flavobacterium columnare]|uniref:DUF3226 domain-containing protein n=1 Tax=Flavobacterium columnare TaxID=996 RepID=UPI002D2101A0|nr:DUF3226 domain-containing protein [Flavobacterium columnare]MEB3801069.1 hypothetical protein [Flavobacterium columnare]